MVTSSHTIIACSRPFSVGSYWALRLPSNSLSGVTLSRAAFEVGSITGKALVRRLNDGTIALLLDRLDSRFAKLNPDIPLDVKVHLLADRNKSRVPSDVISILAEAHLSLSDLTESDIRHLVTMVQESKTKSIRESRIRSYVSSRQSRAAQQENVGGSNDGE